MDPVSLGFYAIVCGLLGAVAPNFPRLPVRLGIGALVGVTAASVLPWIKGMMGGPY
ncbi:MAG: hypothetical protein ACE368_18205 [Paracoccaceae bacterium]